MKKTEKGFTMIELILYMGLLSIFLFVLMDIFISILDVRTESEATSSVQEDGRFILARLNYDISRASSITTPANLGDSSNSLVMIINGITHTYSLSGGKIQLENDQGNFPLNSPQTIVVSPLNFQKIGSGVIGGKETVKIQFTVSSAGQMRSGSETRTFLTTAGRRS